MGSPHGLQYSEIESYLRLAGVLGDEQRSFYAHMISVLDRHFMDDQRKKSNGN